MGNCCVDESQELLLCLDLIIKHLVRNIDQLHQHLLDLDRGSIGSIFIDDHVGDLDLDVLEALILGFNEFDHKHFVFKVLRLEVDHV